MAKKKATTKKLSERQQINQVTERLRLFNKILFNDLEMRYLDEEQVASLKGQIMGHQNAILMLEQAVKRGELWLGGYLDNVGVVYSDQVLEHYNQQEAMKVTS